MRSISEDYDKNKYKAVLVGDGFVGKTCLLVVLEKKCFPEPFVPTIQEIIYHNVDYNGKTYTLELWDTAGQEEYDRLREVGYRDTDLFILCYDVSKEMSSFINAKQKWIQEIRNSSKDAPVLLVGTKIDIRKDPKNPVYTTKDGEKLMKQLGADGFVECSASENRGIEEMLLEAVKIIVTRKESYPSRRKNEKKCILQ